MKETIDFDVYKEKVLDFIENLEKEVKVAISVKNRDFAEGAMFVLNKVRGDNFENEKKTILRKRKNYATKRNKIQSLAN